ncbi:MAG: tetratricopeptide repeat protein [Candidatus Lokiarchaeota archaeon]|nr:tetratricopeptide repeat protein [Candidatus Lokiarchaeota archaeon]
MSEQNVKAKPKELILVKQLIDEGKNEKALQVMNNFEQTGEHTLHEIVSCHLLKCELLEQQGLYEDLVKFTEQTYKESLGLGKNLLSVDALYFRTLALIQLYRIEEASAIITQGEELLKILTNKLTTDYKKRKARIVWAKGMFNNKFYNQNGDVNIALEHFYQSLTLREEVGDKEEIGISLQSIIFNLGAIKGETDDALKYVERFLALVEKNELKNKFTIAYGLTNVQAVYDLRGDLDRSIKYYEQSLEVFKELNNKPQIAYGLLDLGEKYRMKGEDDRALEYGEQGLALFYELEMLIDCARAHGLLIQMLIGKGDLELARQHLDEIEQINNQSKDKKVNLWYLYYKALILKTSPRAKNRVEAEEILKEIIEEENEYLLDALLELCDLLLIELRMTNDLEVLEEIESFIARLLDESERMSSYTLLAETYFLKAKLALLTLDVKKARRFLTQAQQIAERWGFNLLATKISGEHDRLLNQQSMWENLKDSEISLTERIKLAGLDEQMSHLLRKSSTFATQVREEEVTIHREKKICIVCKGDVLGFMFTCKCDTVYCENCARALTDLENTCWVCNAPIDKSKPIKPYEKEIMEEKDIIKENNRKLKNK